MARPRSAKVQTVKTQLSARLADAVYRPGTRFLSARAVVARYDISYQTAHRLLAELAAEGKLLRRAASGTYRLGTAITMTGVEIVFHERARRPNSFGARLLSELTEQLARDRIDVRVTWYRDRVPRLQSGRVAVLWEAPLALQACVQRQRPAVVLNDRPPPGIESTHIDSVGVDDFSGGACAGQLLLRRCGALRAKRFLIVTGPSADRRSIARVEGCRSVLPRDVRAISAGGWYLRDGVEVARRVLREKPAAIFCCNDRLAEGLLHAAARSDDAVPSIVGYDDAPIAEMIGLTTIAIPWHELAAAASTVVRRRLVGDVGAASHQMVAPHPVVRWVDPAP